MQSDVKLAKFLQRNIKEFNKTDFFGQNNVKDIVEFNAKYNLAPLSINNDVKIYTDIAEQYEDMINDISDAKKSVNILYFVYRKDIIGAKLLEILVQKAREGVKIKLIVDDIGSLWANRGFFKPLIDGGGEVLRFLAGPWKYLNRNLNFRNHRKMVIIDNEIAYTGGANIGDEYMNQGEIPWRDTHMKVTGDAVALINLRFLQDYAYIANKDVSNLISDFGKHEVTKILPMQLISSGPDVLTEEIKQTYIKLIYGAKERIWLQTPYYIPDDSFADAVATAVRGGVDVRIMIPEIPDKKAVYYATKSYVSDMVKIGAKVYLYPAFIHSKTLVVDNEIASLGTFNIDIRSFKLHFELTMLMYGKEIVSKMADIFMNDVNKSAIMDEGYLRIQSKTERLMQMVMRLFSPLF
jgi:cardiolipin synthase